MAKNLKTFVISKTQIAHLRNILIANGETAEAEKLSGSDLALRYKCINMPDMFPKGKVEAFTKQYPYFAGFDLREIKPEPKESPIAEGDASEMTATETTGKKNKKNKTVAPEPTTV